MSRHNIDHNLIEVRAKLNYLRQSPRKVRLLVDLIRHLPVETALQQLTFSSKRAARPLSKLLKSAIANAENNHHLAKDNLFIKEIRVDQGPVLKRWRARAMGRAAAIRKRTSHILLILAEIKPTATKVKASATDKNKAADKQQDVKIISSLDEIKSVGSEQPKGGSTTNIPSAMEKSKGPATTKRKLFSRTSG